MTVMWQWWGFVSELALKLDICLFQCAFCLAGSCDNHYAHCCTFRTYTHAHQAITSVLQLTTLSQQLDAAKKDAPEQEAAEVGFSFVLEAAMMLNMCLFHCACLAWREVETTDDCLFLHTAAPVRIYTHILTELSPLSCT